MTDTIHLRFPARSEYLLLARLAVTGVARRMGLNGKDVADLKLAVTEACSNTVRHAYPASQPGEIELAIVADDDRLELVVEDHGAGITTPLPEAPDPSEQGGMGIALIRAVVDDLEIGRTSDGGTVVHMTKRSRGRHAASKARPREV